MSLKDKNLKPEQVAKVKKIISAGVETSEKIKYLRDALRDDVKAIADEIDVKPKVLNQAIRVAYKADRAEKQEEFSEVDEILDIAGRK